jgi:hypothetical protein
MSNQRSPLPFRALLVSILAVATATVSCKSEEPKSKDGNRSVDAGAAMSGGPRGGGRAAEDDDAEQEGLVGDDTADGDDMPAADDDTSDDDDAPMADDDVMTSDDEADDDVPTPRPPPDTQDDDADPGATPQSVPDVPNGGAGNVGPPPPDSLCEGGGSEAGAVVADLAVLTRVNGVSPETVYFSAQGSTASGCTDLAGGHDAIACATGQYLGFHFSFDDPESGRFASTGNSKNEQIGGAPRAVHTFVCDAASNRYNPDSQRCEYAVRVRAQDPDGNFDDACVQVNIVPQEVAYAPRDTYCVSAEGDFEGCPEGVPNANKVNDSLDAGSYSGRRVLYAQGSTSSYSMICTGYDERNVRVGTYGAGTRPLVSGINVGVDSECGDNIPTTDTASGYPELMKDDNGNIVQGWAYDIGMSGLRVGSISMGMSATLVTLHDLDLDWSGDGDRSGYVELVGNAQYCTRNDDLDCAVVPYPYGIFLSEVRALGRDPDPPLANFGCFNQCGMVNSALVGVEAKRAEEHNVRVMGSWGTIVSNAWLRGDHIGDAGPKHKLTLRNFDADVETSQVANPEDFLAGGFDGGPGWRRGQSFTELYSPHFNFVIDGKFGDTEQDDRSREAGLVHIAPGHQYSGAFGSVFVDHEGADLDATQFFLGGRNLTVAGTTYSDRVTCRYDDDTESPTYYSDYSLIFSDAPDGGCNRGNTAPNPPRPDAP